MRGANFEVEVRDVRRVNRIQIGVLAAAVAIATGVGAWWVHNAYPKRFAVVEEGSLYRSGELSPRELRKITSEFRIKTVISLLAADAPETVAEREAAARIGLHWVNIPLPGDGASTAEERQRIKDALFDPDAGPTLVHCAAGTNRTGLTIGMYRIHVDGWTVDQVLDEMREFDFEDLPKHENLRQALQAEWEAAHHD